MSGSLSCRFAPRDDDVDRRFKHAFDAEGIAMDKTSLPNGAVSDDAPTTRIPESARRLAIAMVRSKPSWEPPVAFGKRSSVLDTTHLEDASIRPATSAEAIAERARVGLPNGAISDDVPTTKLAEAALRMVRPAAGKEPPPAPSLVLQDRSLVLDSTHLEDGSEPPRPSEAPAPGRPDPSLSPVRSHVSLDGFLHYVPDLSSHRLAVILCSLFACALVVLAIAANSRP